MKNKKPLEYGKFTLKDIEEAVKDTFTTYKAPRTFTLISHCLERGLVDFGKLGTRFCNNEKCYPCSNFKKHMK